MRVTFNGLAERELNDAIQYYEKEQAGLGTALLAEVRPLYSRDRRVSGGESDRLRRRPAPFVPAVPVRLALLAKQ